MEQLPHGIYAASALPVNGVRQPPFAFVPFGALQRVRGGLCGVHPQYMTGRDLSL